MSYEPVLVECTWCGQPYEAHLIERAPGKPVPRMPCLGLRSHFLARRLTQPTQREATQRELALRALHERNYARALEVLDDAQNEPPEGEADGSISGPEWTALRGLLSAHETFRRAWKLER